jgi:alpha-galactosidase
MVQLFDGVTLRTPATAVRPTDEGWLVVAEHLEIEVDEAATEFLQHGWHSFSATGWRDLARAPRPLPVPELAMISDDPAYTSTSVHGGSGVGALRGADTEVLLLGGLGFDVRVEAGAHEIIGRVDGAPIEWFVARGPEHAMLARYADLLGERLGRREIRDPKLWESWYSYFEDITEPRILRTLGDVAELPFEVFQVDDGWQQAVGDWEPNADFPSGMEALAATIRSQGLTPGLWLAPFIAWPSSRLFRERPDWFVRDDQGAPARVGYNWGDWYHVLDLSRDDVLDHLGEVISTARGWGFEMLKLDFLFAGAIPGQRARPGPREACYRRAIERIREAAGDDAYLLACGAPVIASVGVFDALRVSTDVAPYWDNPVLTEVIGAGAEVSTRNAISTSLHRLWLRGVIATDPDVVFFRSRYNLLRPAERQLLQDLARVAGFRGSSDPPHWLDPHELAAMRAFFADDGVEVAHLDGYRYLVDGREVDFSVAVRSTGHLPTPVPAP